ncbi:MAG: DegQ family serine endoprotease [Desulfofustis sp. PB-SRB1]|nr:DegQ family serine endoprotease [Desulfofustis sp. PB-SRB1]
MNRTQFLSIVTGMLLLLLVPLSGYADEAEERVAMLDRSAKVFAEVVKDVTPAVVHIRVESTVDMNPEFDEFFNHPFFERFFGPEFRRFQDPEQRKRRQQGAGSGFIISNEGHILTNNHVVENAEDITVTLADSSTVKAELVGADPQSDVALIKIDVDETLPTVPLGDSDKLDVGEWVIAIGNPFGLNQTVTVGVVSAKGRSRVGINEYEDFIQTDAAINPGNSGGPLLNIHGEVVGINSALYSRTGGYMGIGFAIPINMAKSIESQLQEFGKVTRGWLGVGIQDIDEQLAQSFNLPDSNGILVTEVHPDTPAEKGGIKEGDVIVKLDNEAVADVAELRNGIAMTSPGTDLAIEIFRDGTSQTIKVTIGEQPDDFGMVAQKSNETLLSPFGLVVQELTPELAEQFGYENRQGVIISEVIPDSPAARANLRSGHLIEEVNQNRITSLAELQQVLDQNEGSNRVLLKVRVGNFSQYIVLNIE